MDGSGASPRRPAGVRVSHVVRTPLTLDRASALAARALDDAMHALGISNCALAEFLGVSEGVIRAMRRGEKPITSARLLQLPPSLRAEVLRRLAAVGDDGLVAPPREMQVSILMAAAGRVIVACATAGTDGEVTEAEVRDLIGPELAAFDRAAEPLRAGWCAVIALGLILLCVAGLTWLCASSDRARDVADRALEEAVLEADRLRTELRARDEENELLRAAVVASEGRRWAAILHARRTRNALAVTQEQLVTQTQAAHQARCQRDDARSEAARAKHEQVVIARARGSEMPS